MKKGYLILFSIIFCLMIIFPLPCLKTAGRQGSNPRKIDSENESFRVIFPDGSICEMSAKDYVFGVLAAEMSPSVPEQALKAQAVCAYTFASRKKADRKIVPPSELDGADISADYHIDQGFLTKEQAREKWGQKADEYEQKLKKIVDETAGVSVRYDGSFALTLYHAISAGRTESAQNVFGEDIPYLVPVQSVGDILCDECCSSAEFSKEEFSQKLKSISNISETNFSEDFIGQKQCSDSGTVLSVELFGQSFSGKDIRNAFSLRSANFDIEYDEEKGLVIFSVRGYGHLVGMSQKGAEIMAENGSDYKEILLHYYPGCEVWD